ncbi:hypothetical protein EK21DRAFT_59426, partial [Setomelanomma holmii]
AVIGVVLSNGNIGQDHFKCHAPGCFDKTFGRLAELKRHHKCKHETLARKPQFWCPVGNCDRSKSGAGGSFPRKDKMMDHLSRKHADIVGS